LISPIRAGSATATAVISIGVIATSTSEKPYQLPSVEPNNWR